MSIWWRKGERVFWQFLTIYVCAALVTFCLCQPKRRREHVHLCLCLPVSAVSPNVGAAGGRDLYEAVWHIVCVYVCLCVCVCVCMSAGWHMYECASLCVHQAGFQQYARTDSGVEQWKGGCSWHPLTSSSNSLVNFPSESSRKRGKLFDVL